MAGAKFFDIQIKARGSHAAMPHNSKDPIVIAMTLGQSLQSIVSRNVNPLKPAVLSITKFAAGSAYNVDAVLEVMIDGLRAEIDERERAVDDAFAGRGDDARPGNPS